MRQARFLFLRVYSAKSSLPGLGGYVCPIGGLRSYNRRNGKRAMIAINRRATPVPSGTTWPRGSCIQSTKAKLDAKLSRLDKVKADVLMQTSLDLLSDGFFSGTKQQNTIGCKARKWVKFHRKSRRGLLRDQAIVLLQWQHTKINARFITRETDKGISRTRKFWF